MRRFAALLSVLALAGAAPAYAGTPTRTSSATFTDAQGDWAVPMQDVISGRVEATLRKNTVQKVRLSARMASNLTGTPGDYDLILGGRDGNTCHVLAVRIRWSGAYVAQSYSYESSFACSSESSAIALAGYGVQVLDYAVGGGPAVAYDTGDGVVADLQAPAWLRPGMDATYTAFVHPPVTATIVFATGSAQCTCDFGYLTKTWRV